MGTATACLLLTVSQDLACQYNSIPTFPSRNRDSFLLKILSTELKMTYSLS